VDQYLALGRSTDDSKDYIGNFRDSSFKTTMDLASWQNDIKLPVGEALLAAEYNRQKVSSTTDYTVNERTIRSLLAGWNGHVDQHRLQLNLRHDDNSQFGGKSRVLLPMAINSRRNGAPTCPMVRRFARRPSTSCIFPRSSVSPAAIPISNRRRQKTQRSGSTGSRAVIALRQSSTTIR
jgi:hypothetical protein